MIFSGTLVGFAWTLYAICLNNFAMALQYAILFVLSAGQLSLFLIYPNKATKATKATKSSKSSSPKKPKSQ